MGFNCIASLIRGGVSWWYS